VAFAVALAACSVTLPGTPLSIDTADFQLFSTGCAGVGLPAFRIERDGDKLRYVNVETVEAMPLRWPNGFSARLVDGVATLYSGTGGIVAKEHDVIDDAGGCPRSDGSILVDLNG
jgi:hypothetical protein